MTDKEQIIIDGVDITRCCHRENNLCSCPHYKKECARNPNCHFKIVERQRKKIDKFYRKELELCKQLARKTQECEELEKQLETSEEWRIKAESLNEKLELRNTCYCKSLEEIEKVINNILNSCLGRNTVSCRPAHNVCGDLIKILNIIDKAKGAGICQ